MASKAIATGRKGSNIQITSDFENGILRFSNNNSDLWGKLGEAKWSMALYVSTLMRVVLESFY